MKVGLGYAIGLLHEGESRLLSLPSPSAYVDPSVVRRITINDDDDGDADDADNDRPNLLLLHGHKFLGVVHLRKR